MYIELQIREINAVWISFEKLSNLDTSMAPFCHGLQTETQYSKLRLMI